MEYVPDNYDMWEIYDREREKVHKQSSFMADEQYYENMEEEHGNTLRINE